MAHTIAVIGTGYVGLTTGACFAALGHTVICADIDEEKVARLNRGEIPIVEDGLERLVAEGRREGRLSFVVGAAQAAAEAEFAYLCVPTPQGEDGSADLSYIEAAAREIGPVLAPESVVVNKSTVPVGSTRVVERALGRSDVYVVSNPEFLREGSAVNDFMKPDRIVIGSDHQGAAIRVASLYMGIPAPIMVTDPASAETIKYAANAFLATKLSFVNAVAAICEAVGADVADVMLGIGYDKRIGQDFLQPGPGWGGSCFVGDETLLVRRGSDVRLRTFADVFADVEAVGAEGWEVLAWTAGAPTPEFHPIAAFTRRPYAGDVIDIRTKMGRRLTVTADHPMLIADGVTPHPTEVVPAGELVTDDWLPLAIGAPLPLGDLEDDEAVVEAIETVRGQAPATAAVPDLIWNASEPQKRMFLQGLWWGDGSWSFVNGGPSVVLEYGTVSKVLADGMVRLLADLGVVARMKTGRSAESTTDAWFLTISGADQVEECLWLVPPHERETVTASLARQAKRIAPTGYRRLDKNVAWVRVTEAEPRPYEGFVYSVEVPGPHTVVSTAGLVAHNCFPKDTRALARIAEDAGYDFHFLKGVLAVNEEQFDRVADKIERLAGGSVDGKRVAVWGLTFKARTDDLRESPSLEVIARLRQRGAHVVAYDPAVHHDLEGIEVVSDPYAPCDGAEVLAVLTEWDEFRWLDFDKVHGLMAAPRIVDGRNLLDAAALKRRGFAYDGIGRS